MMFRVIENEDVFGLGFSFRCVSPIGRHSDLFFFKVTLFAWTFLLLKKDVGN